MESKSFAIQIFPLSIPGTLLLGIGFARCVLAFWMSTARAMLHTSSIPGPREIKYSPNAMSRTERYDV